MLKLFQKPQSPFWLLLILVASALMLRQALSIGMFVDGETYATIARNLAEGRGRFWDPFYTETLYPNFFEHPPLVIGIESLFFRVFGDGYFVEKGYSLLTFFITAWLILKIWKITLGNEVTGLGWLPLLLWVITPLTYWAYVNNMLENTMGIFCIGSIALLLYGWKVQKNRIIIWLGAGLLIFCGLLSKGPFALFPLAVPFLYWLTLRGIRFSDVIVSSLLMLFVIIGGFAVLWQWPAARYNLDTYIHTQLLASLNGQREHINGSHFTLLIDLINQLVPVFILLAIGLVLWKFVMKKSLLETRYKTALFFLLIAVSASFPIMISPKQMIHYVICSIPFYAVAAGVVLWPYVKYGQGRINTESRMFKRTNNSLIVGIGIVVLFSVLWINTPGRDFDLLNSLQHVEKDLPKGGKINCSSHLYYNWLVHAYLYRFYHVSLDDKDTSTGYYLTNYQDREVVPAGYKPVYTGRGAVYVLYKKDPLLK